MCRVFLHSGYLGIGDVSISGSCISTTGSNLFAFGDENMRAEKGGVGALDVTRVNRQFWV